MDQILEFGKRYGKWIAAGVVAAAVTVAGVVAYRSSTDEGTDYYAVEPDEGETVVVKDTDEN